MAVELLADHNLKRTVVLLLREGGHDIVALRELDLHGANDDELLLFAATEQRTLLTCNIDDFVLLHSAWIRWSAHWDVGPSTQASSSSRKISPGTRRGRLPRSKA